MKVLFHLGHPAHFHLFKNVISKLQDQNHEIHILIKDKDVLRNLLDSANLPYHNILKEGKSSGKSGMLKDLLKRGRRMIRYCREVKPDILVGTSVDIPYTGKILGIPSVNVNEDDAGAVPLYAWMAYPFSTKIISPDSCDNGRWQKKTTHYPGYHELAYLHPDHFEADKKTVSKYISPGEEYVILRFAGLNAHHDNGVRGINNETALELVNALLPFKKVIITSERELLPELEPYRIAIHPTDMHDILAHASFIVGDSQTMSAEAAVLGTPYIRYNDFVGKIGYLKELEEKYQLGYGIKPENNTELIQRALKLAKSESVKTEYHDKRMKMLSDKINTADYLYTEIIHTVVRGK